MRVFIDTNVLVSAFATRGLSADLVRLVLVEYEFLTGEVNLEELTRVLKRRFRTSDQLIESILTLLREQVIIPRPSAPADVPERDPDDQWVVASALDGEADVLVTGDRDLLDLGSEAPLPIVTPRGFWEMVRRTD